MNNEHKSNLEKALVSQTWNKHLAEAVVDAIADNLKRPKSKEKPTVLQIAVAKGKKQYDKRQTKKSRDWNREKARYFRKSS